jgi:hypothetical protein
MSALHQEETLSLLIARDDYKLRRLIFLQSLKGLYQVRALNISSRDYTLQSIHQIFSEELIDSAAYPACHDAITLFA